MKYHRYAPGGDSTTSKSREAERTRSAAGTGGPGRGRTGGGLWPTMRDGPIFGVLGLRVADGRADPPARWVEWRTNALQAPVRPATASTKAITPSSRRDRTWRALAF